MPNLNQLELQHLRHLIGAHETAYQKLNTFSSLVYHKADFIHKVIKTKAVSLIVWKILYLVQSINLMAAKIHARKQNKN